MNTCMNVQLKQTPLVARASRVSEITNEPDEYGAHRPVLTQSRLRRTFSDLLSGKWRGGDGLSFFGVGLRRCAEVGGPSRVVQQESSRAACRSIV